jgi:hypothetical protein
MFRLSKWYLDCVTEAGDAVLLHWARMRWGVLHVRYGAALVTPCADGSTDRYTLLPDGPPIAGADGSVRWECGALEVRGAWVGRTAGVERMLCEQADGEIRWNCIAPRAEATVHVGGRTLRGLGYVEHLSMSVKPWRLPFNGLQWGRYVSPADAVAWIRWEGDMPRTWAFEDGVDRLPARITEHRVELPAVGRVLSFEDGRVLRTGRLSTTALRSLRVLAWLVPGWRTAHETKWLARGTLVGPETRSAGWVVHEAVRWS